MKKSRAKADPGAGPTARSPSLIFAAKKIETKTKSPESLHEGVGDETTDKANLLINFLP